MANMTNYLEDKLVEYIFRGGTFAAPATYVALSTSTINEDSTGMTEPSGNGYARQLVGTSGWSATSAGDTRKTSNSGDISFTANGGDWGTITHVAIMDGSGSGANMLFYAVLSTSKTVSDGDTFKFSATNLSIEFK